MPTRGRPRLLLFIMKRLLSLLLLLIVTFTSLHAADGDKFNYNGIYYTVISENDKTCETKEGTGYSPEDNSVSGDITIPEKVINNGIEYTVIAIGKSSFEYCKNLTSIIIPNTVAKIDKSAFSYCSALRSVSIPNSVLEIGESAFTMCTSLSSVTIPNSVTTIGKSIFSHCSALASVTISSSIDKISNNTFEKCISLTSVTIPNSVTQIGDHAFSYCSALSNLTIPNYVTTIGYFAFSDCITLSSISIPNSVTEIKTSAFARCPSLKSVIVEDGDSFLALDLSNAPIETFYMGRICEYNGDKETLTNLTIGNKVTTIPNGAFSGCINLKSINLNKIETIENYAFQNCSALTSISIPSSVNRILEYAFAGCAALKSFTIEGGESPISCDTRCLWDSPIETLSINRNWGFNGFNYIKTLVSVEIGEKVTEIKSGCLSSNPALQSINIMPDNPNYSSIDGVLYNKNATGLILCPEGKTSVDIPESVTTISDKAFYSCLRLSSVAIPSSVTTIGASAFYNCSSLTSIVIPESVSTIGYQAFKDCNSLTKSAYPSSVKNPFGNGVAVQYPAGRCIFENGFIWKNDKSTLYFAPCSLSGDYSIPNSVSEIGQNAFYGCSYLKSVTIPNSVVIIGSSAFKNCPSLDVIISKAINSPCIQSDTFDGVYDIAILNIPVESGPDYLSTYWMQFKNISLDGQGITSSSYSDNAFNYALIDDLYTPFAIVTAPVDKETRTAQIPSEININGTLYPVKAIGINAFKDSKSLTDLIMPSSIEIIGPAAFQNCVYMSDFDLPASLKRINNNAFAGCTRIKRLELPRDIAIIGKEAFSGCTALSSVSLSHINHISEGLFRNCSKLATIEIPSNVTDIGNGAFSACSALNSIRIPNSVETIGNNAFNKCNSLSLAIIGDSVTSIGISAFKDCYKLKDVTFGKSVTTIADSAFCYCYKLNPLTLPSSLKTIGCMAFDNCESLSTLVIPNSVTYIDDAAFARCWNLISVTVEDGNSEIEFGNKVFDSPNPFAAQALTNLYMGRNWNGYLGVKSLTNIIIGDNVTEIPDFGFFECNRPYNLKFGSQVTSIGKYAFAYNLIADLTLSPSIRYIDDYAFAGSYHLKNFTSSPCLEKIGEGAFSECYELEKIIIGSNVKVIGDKAFDGCNTLKSVISTAIEPPVAANNSFSFYDLKMYIPQGSQQDYNDSYCWHLFLGYEDPGVNIEPVSIKSNVTTIDFDENNTFQINASIEPANVTVPYLFYMSTNPRIATVDSNGLVTMHKNTPTRSEMEAETNNCEIRIMTLYADGPVSTIKVKDLSAIDEIIADIPSNQEQPNNIYNMQGILIKADATPDDINELAPALYIIGGRKVFIK